MKETNPHTITFTIYSVDPLEVGTEDKLVLAALGDGSVRGIHLGTKTEVRNRKRLFIKEYFELTSK